MSRDPVLKEKSNTPTNKSNKNNVQDIETSENVVDSLKWVKQDLPKLEINFVLDSDDEVIKVLDEAAKHNEKIFKDKKRTEGHFASCLLIGDSGYGKQEKTELWASTRGYKLRVLDVAKTHVKRTRSIKYWNKFTHEISKNSTYDVFYLKGLNELSKEDQLAFLSLIERHENPSFKKENEPIYLSSVLLVIAEITPNIHFEDLEAKVDKFNGLVSDVYTKFSSILDVSKNYKVKKFISYYSKYTQIKIDE